MQGKKGLKINLKKIEKMNNINQSLELTGQESSKKNEKQFLFSLENQKNETKLNQKDFNKKAVSFKVEENKVSEIVNIPENCPNLFENIGESSILGNSRNENNDLNDPIDESDIQNISNILRNNEKYNILIDENSNDANLNSTRYIFVGLK